MRKNETGKQKQNISTTIVGQWAFKGAEIVT